MFPHLLPHFFSAERTLQRGMSTTSCLYLHQPPAPMPTLSAIKVHQVSTTSEAQISACSLYFICSCLSSGFCFLLSTQELHSMDYLFNASGFCPYPSTEILNKVINNLFVQFSGPFLLYLTSWQHLILVVKACCMYSPDL